MKHRLCVASRWEQSGEEAKISHRVVNNFADFRSIYKATNFDDAHTECAKVGATLMPIGKLRYFKPTFENIKDVAWKEYGWFRLCARKTGKLISKFHIV